MGNLWSGEEEKSGTSKQTKQNDVEDENERIVFDSVGFCGSSYDEDKYLFEIANDMSGIEKLENYGVLPVDNHPYNHQHHNKKKNWKKEVFDIFFTFKGKNEYYKKLFFGSVKEKWIDRGIKETTKYSNSVRKWTRDYDKLFKFLLIGDSGVGKSCLLMRKTEKSFTQSYISTIGVDFKHERAMYKNHQFKLQIWDTAGEERFRTITSSYYRGCSGIILCYSIADDYSFKNVKAWIKDAEMYGPEDCQVVVVGCKCDLENERKVTKSQVKKFFEDGKEEIGGLVFPRDWCETSSKDDLYIDLPFGILLEKILRNLSSKKMK